MGDALTYRLEDGIIYIKGSGDYSLNSVNELIREIIQEAKTHEKYIDFV